jgi:Flp pilus assembly pilin Flp
MNTGNRHPIDTSVRYGVIVGIASVFLLAIFSWLIGLTVKITLTVIGWGHLIGWRDSFYIGLGYALIRIIDRMAWGPKKISDPPI